jgi:maltose O-acetyltransferase
MQTELEKCLAGECYNCHDSIFLEYKQKSRVLLREYNSLEYNQKGRKTEILRELFESIGENVSVGQPFICDYGCNIS